MKRKGLKHHLSNSIATHELSLIINLHVKKSSTSCNAVHYIKSAYTSTFSTSHVFEQELEKESWKNPLQVFIGLTEEGNLWNIKQSIAPWL